jgi:hypothetical protein
MGTRIAGGRVPASWEEDPLLFYDRLAGIDLSALRASAPNVHGLRLIVYDGSRIVVDVSLSLRSAAGGDLTWGQVWRHQIWPRIMLDSSSSILSRAMTWVLVSPVALPPAVALLQAYRDERMGHCFFNPIKTHYLERLETAKSEETRATVRQVLDRCERLAALHAAGIPESAIEDAAKSLRVRVAVCDVFGDNRREFNASATWAKRFVYRNVRWNHLEVCTSEWTLEAIPYRALEDLRASLKEAGKSYLVRKHPSGLTTQLDTPDGRFVLEDPDRAVFQAARDAYFLDGAAVDAIKEPQLATLTAAGCRVTSHANIGAPSEDDPEDYSVLDMKAAYTRGADTGAYYQGYLHTISDVRRLMLTGLPARAHLHAHPGLYCVDDVQSYECSEAVDFYLTELKLFSSRSIVLPSPELLFLWDAGVRFRVRTGAWGPCLPAIDWEKLGLLKAGAGPLFQGTTLYKVWCGQLGHSNQGVKRLWFPGTPQWAAYLRAQGHDALFYDADSDICVQRPAKRSPSNHPTFAFITSYVRINVLQKLLTFPHEGVRAVQLDGIVHACPLPDGAATALWRPKLMIPSDRISEYSAAGWYGFDRGYDDSWITAGPSAITKPVTFLEGAGGSGKSHSVLSDPGFRDVLFAAPMWSLVCFMSRRYGRAGTTVHRLAGEFLDEETGKKTKCRAYHEENSRYPAVVFVDEATMVDARMLQAVLELYRGRSKIIIAGDIRVTGVPASKPPIWFQCRNRTAVFDPRTTAGCALVSYGEDYRATGPLVDLKRKLRDAMVEVFLGSSAEDPGDDVLDARLVAQSVLSLFAANVTTVERCAAEYVPGDTILVGTHELADGWTDALKGRDERYRIARHTAADVKAAQEGHEAYLTGDITRKKTPCGVFTLAFTIHSFQGKTFSDGRLWIDARRVWDYAMLYTAISRCQRLEQIRIMFE